MSEQAFREIQPPAIKSVTTFVLPHLMLRGAELLCLNPAQVQFVSKVNDCGCLKHKFGLVYFIIKITDHHYYCLILYRTEMANMKHRSAFI